MFPDHCTSSRNHPQLQQGWNLCSLAGGVCREEWSCLFNLLEVYRSQHFSHRQPRRPRPQAGPGLSHLQGKQRILPEVSFRDLQSLLLPTHRYWDAQRKILKKHSCPFSSLVFFQDWKNQECSTLDNTDIPHASMAALPQLIS